MPSRTAELHRACQSSPVPRVHLAVTLLLTALAGTACDDDIGRCCSVLDPALADRIPTSTTSSSGNPTSDIALDPAFDCESLICVAYRGSRAFCTARCFSNDDCPEGFECRSVLESSPGEGAEIQPGDRFCVRDRHVCAE